MTTRILIGDSNSLSVFGAKILLEKRADTEVMQAENSTILLASAKTLQPGIIILGDHFDPLMDTPALVEVAHQAAPAAGIIVMGMLSDGLLIRDLLAMAVMGYLMVGDDLTTCLPKAVEMALRQRPYLSPTANAEYLIAMQSSSHGWKLDTEARSVLRLLAGGFTVQEIALKLGFPRRRAYWVCEKLRARFGATTNAHLISRAVAEGFTSFPD